MSASHERSLEERTQHQENKQGKGREQNRKTANWLDQPVDKQGMEWTTIFPARVLFDLDKPNIYLVGS